MKKENNPQYCKADYLGRHCWKHLGIYNMGKNVYEVWKCTQCKKCMNKKLEFVNIKSLKGGKPNDRTRNKKIY